MGIEPTSLAWEAKVMAIIRRPLWLRQSRLYHGWQSSQCQVWMATPVIQRVWNSSAILTSNAEANVSIASKEGFAAPVSIRLMYVRAKPT